MLLFKNGQAVFQFVLLAMSHLWRKYIYLLYSQIRSCKWLSSCVYICHSSYLFLALTVGSQPWRRESWHSLVQCPCPNEAPPVSSIHSELQWYDLCQHNSIGVVVFTKCYLDFQPINAMTCCQCLLIELNVTARWDCFIRTSPESTTVQFLFYSSRVAMMWCAGNYIFLTEMKFCINETRIQMSVCVHHMKSLPANLKNQRW
jgi:hypothetical protein